MQDVREKQMTYLRSFAYAIISEIAEIIASAADGCLVLYFFVQYFGKKDKIRWWEYVIWMSAFFVDGTFSK